MTAFRRFTTHPFHALANFDRDAIERLIKGAAEVPAAFLRARASVVNESESHWTLEIDVPGIEKGLLDLRIEGDHLYVKTRESSPRQISSAYHLPEEIDPSTSSSTLENGVLKVLLGKKILATQAHSLKID